MAPEPLPAPAVRRVQRPELAGDAEQPPVRGGRGDADGVELRRVGRGGPATPRGARPGRRRSAGAAASCRGSRRSGASPCCSRPSPAASSTRWPARGGRSAWARSRSGSPTRPSSSPGRSGCPSGSSASTTATPRSTSTTTGPGARCSPTPGSKSSAPGLYERYLDLRARITEDRPGWRGELDREGRPAVLAGHADSATLGAVVMSSAALAVRLVRPDRRGLRARRVRRRGGVARRRLRGAALPARPGDRPARDARPAGLGQGAVGLRGHAPGARPRRPGPAPGAARPRLRPSRPARRPRLARRLEGPRPARDVPRVADGEPVPRYRLPLDPVFDLSPVRATYALRRALEAAPEDFMTLLLLARGFGDRGMADAELPYLERLVLLRPINPEQAAILETATARIVQLRARLVSAPPATWENLSELDQIVADAAGRRPPRLGRRDPGARLPRRAEALGGRRPPGDPPPPPGRAGAGPVDLGEGRRPAPPGRADGPRRADAPGRGLDSRPPARPIARRSPPTPTLFEAHYGLAVLEQDAGRAARRSPRPARPPPSPRATSPATPPAPSSRSSRPTGMERTRIHHGDRGGEKRGERK